MPRTSGAPPGGRMCEQAVAEHRRVRKWLRRCLGPKTELKSFRRLPGYSQCELVACETDRGSVVLKRYAPGFVDYSDLGPTGVARKHALVLQELPALGVPTPRLLGFAAQGKQALGQHGKQGGGRQDRGRAGLERQVPDQRELYQ